MTTLTDPPQPLDRTSRQRRRRRWLLASAAVALVLAIAAGVGIWYFLRDDAPAAVSLEGAVASLPASSERDDATSVAPPAVAATGADEIAGTWAVDTSIGAFSFEDTSGTFVGFRVQEELASIGETTAVGRTPAVTGTITIDGTALTSATIEADMTELTTNDGRRDSRVHGALDTSQFPTATFVLTEPVELGAGAVSGDPVDVVATGELTIHGVARTVSLPLSARLVDGTVIVVGSLEVTFADYGVSVPDAPIVVSAEDHGIVELQLLLTRS